MSGRATAIIRSALLCLAIVSTASATTKGRYWSYTMSGCVYDKTTKEVLRNTAIMIGKQMVTTDSTGHYAVTLSGITCDRGTLAQMHRCNEDAYGTLVIRRSLGGTGITIRSHWQSYVFGEGRNAIVPWNQCRRDLFIP